MLRSLVLAACLLLPGGYAWAAPEPKAAPAPAAKAAPAPAKPSPAMPAPAACARPEPPAPETRPSRPVVPEKPACLDAKGGCPGWEAYSFNDAVKAYNLQLQAFRPLAEAYVQKLNAYVKASGDYAQCEVKALQ